MNYQNHIDGHETNLDFVRAFAVLAVVAAHLGSFFGNLHVSFLEVSLVGRLGVVIFFVHSGIVNLLSIERHVHKHGENGLFRAFMTRRALRIYPLSVLIVALIYLTHIPVAHIENWVARPANHSRAELVPSLLLVQNFFQFDQLLDPLWSLPYEIQMYCLFPWIYLALRRFRSTRSVVFAWALLAAVQFVLAPHLANHKNLGGVFAIPDLLFFFLWFLSGIYAYKEMQTSERSLPFWTLPTLIGIACLLCCLSYDRAKFVFIGFCFGLALPYIKSGENLVVNRACAWVAKYSYGIYLLHDPGIWLGFVRFSHLPAVARSIIFLLTTFGGSVLLYHALEHPMILVGNRAASAIAKGKTVLRLQAAAAGGGL